MSVFEIIKNNNLTEAEVEEALEYYLDKKNKVFEKNGYKNRLLKNLKNYYDEIYSTNNVKGSERYTNRITAYTNICDKLVDSLVDAGYKIVIVSALVGYYVDPNTLKAYPVVCKQPSKLGSYKDLEEKIETKNNNKKNKQVLWRQFLVTSDSPLCSASLASAVLLEQQSQVMLQKELSRRHLKNHQAT